MGDVARGFLLLRTWRSTSRGVHSSQGVDTRAHLGVWALNLVHLLSAGHTQPPASVVVQCAVPEVTEQHQAYQLRACDLDVCASMGHA